MAGLRLFAALHIVTLHLPISRYFPTGLRRIVEHAYLSTSLFLILSGFILYYVYVRDDGTLRVPRRTFWLARFARLYPLLIVGHLLMVPAWLLGEQWYPPGEALVRAALVLTGLQAWFPTYGFSYNFVGWTLSVLAFAYLVFPYVIRGIRQLHGPMLLLGLAGVWVLGLVAPSILTLTHPAAVAQPTSDPVPFDAVWLRALLHHHPLLRLPEFLSGILLAKLFVERGWRDLRSGGLLVVVAIVTIVALTQLAPARWYLLLHNGLAAPLHWLLIVGVATAGGWVASALRHERIAALGDASLAIYMVHYPLYVVLSRLLQDGWPLHGHPVPWLLLYFGVILAAAKLLTDHFSNPLYARLLGRVAPPRPGAHAAGHA